MASYKEGERAKTIYEKKQSSSSQFEEFITNFEKGDFQLTDKVSYNIRTVIQNNEKMFHGKFDTAKDGTFEKIFYNIGFILFRTVYQNTDIDTKDINLRSTNGFAIPVVSILKLAVAQYLRKIKFGTFLNDLRYFIKDGTLVVKIVDGELKFVKNENIVIPPWSDGIQTTGLAEKCYYSWEECLANKERWGEAWHYVEELYSRRDEGMTEIPIYEYWHEADNFPDKEGWHKGCTKYLDISGLEASERKRVKNPSEWQAHIELESFSTPEKRRRKIAALRKKFGELEELYPYKELHFIKVPGRWLSFSVFELVAGIQEAYNRKMNLHDKKDILDLMGVFKHQKGTSQASLTQALLQNIESGTIIDLEVDEDLERLIIDTKTGELIANVDKLFSLARQIIGVTSQGAGEDMPATTTATVAIANKQTQQTTYDFAIEQLSLFLTELFEEFYLEKIVEDLSEEELIQITGDPSELEELDKYFISQQVFREAEKYKELVGFYPSQMELDAEMQRLTQEQKGNKDMRFVELKKELLENINVIVEFYVNNEGFDKQSMINNIKERLLDPNSTLSKKKLEATYLDLIGLSGRQFAKSEQELKDELALMQAKANIDNSAINGVLPNNGEVAANDTQAYTNSNTPQQ